MPALLLFHLHYDLEGKTSGKTLRSRFRIVCVGHCMEVKVRWMLRGCQSCWRTVNDSAAAKYGIHDRDVRVQTEPEAIIVYLTVKNGSRTETKPIDTCEILMLEVWLLEYLFNWAEIFPEKYESLRVQACPWRTGLFERHIIVHRKYMVIGKRIGAFPIKR